ncbi:MAG: putative amidase [Betaproteobacteria bacterium]|nr:putative amidase [Betaproteobacteria bacterium]
MEDNILERDELGAFTRHTHVAQEGSGTGPLAGLTFGAKDIYDVAGHKTGFGSPDWLRTHEAAAKTAPIVQQLLDAGADLVGKTHTDELTFSLNGENAHYGTPVNVNAPGRIPGGSSSGSAAAVAGGLVDFALGSDTGGSVRAPASFTGIYGLRPTHGRVSLEGARPLAGSFDTAGWFARDPDVMERVGSVLLAEARDTTQPRRLLIAQDAFDLVGHAAAAALEPGVAKVSALGGRVQRTTVSAEGLITWLDVFRPLQGYEAWAQHGEWVGVAKPELGPGIRQRIEWASTIPIKDFEAAKAKREEITERMKALLRDDAVLVLPTVPDIAPLRDADPKSTEDFRTRALTLLCIAGLSRLPQINLPLGRLNGCPIGLSLIGPRDSDMMLLGMARRIADSR